MLRGTSFAVHVTYTCPLACAHCCFMSGPDVKDGLKPDFILEALASLPDDIGMVAFTGGEPFLHGSHLAAYVRLCKAQGYVTRIVTSAYFGKNPTYAYKRMAEVAEAGLDELSISWDDFHEEFVSFESVLNVIRAAVDLDISVAINSVQLADSRWTRERIARELGDLSAVVTIVTETHVNFTGRAEEKLAGQEQKPKGFLGPCPYVLTGPTLSAKGHLLACCGVIPETDHLVVARDMRAADVGRHIEESLGNPLLNWLFLRGPYALIETIAERRGEVAPDTDKIGGNCEACKILLTDPRFEPHIDAVLETKLAAIASELMLLDSLGFLTPSAVQNLWSSRSMTRIGL